MDVEAKSYDRLLQLHLDKMIERCHKMSDEQWNWRPTPPAPSTKEVVEHAWIWLVMDRLHIENEIDMAAWQASSPPASRTLMIAEFERETKRWHEMLTSMDNRVLDQDRKRSGIFRATVRYFVQHMVQNVIYKSGQLSTLYFAQGLDGEAPFKAPMPNEIQEMVAGLLADPLIGAIIREDHDRVANRIREKADLNKAFQYGWTPLHVAAYVKNPKIVETLLSAGAAINAQDESGATPLMTALSEGDRESAKILIANGANLEITDKQGQSARDYARNAGMEDLIAGRQELLQSGK